MEKFRHHLKGGDIKMLKRLLFCLLILFALVGCGGGTTSNTSSGGSSGSGSGATGSNWDSMAWDQGAWG